MYYKRIYQVIEEEIYQKKMWFSKGRLGKTKNNKLLKNLRFINALQINQFSRD